MWINLLGFWGVGMPLCYYLTFVRSWGVEGLWVGLIAGLSSSGDTSARLYQFCL